MSSSPESQSPSTPDSPRYLAWPVPSVPSTNTHHRQHTSSTTNTSTPAPTMIKSRRFYSSPLVHARDANTQPAKTPLQAYGLEQREPSIAEEKPKLLRRVSHALDDIKEDFSLQLDPKSAAEKLRSRRRGSVFFEPPPTTPPTASSGGRSESALAVERSARPMSMFSSTMSVSMENGNGNGNGGSRFGRRISMFGSGFSQRRKRVGESISQPSLIGSSTHL